MTCFEKRLLDRKVRDVKLNLYPWVDLIDNVSPSIYNSSSVFLLFFFKEECIAYVYIILYC